MKIATLAIITQGDRILLGRKRGDPEIGDGTLNGPGGKKEPDETILAGLVREVEEDFGIMLNPEEVEKVSIITFFAAEEPSFEVHIFRASTFTGKPCETESMVPAWYDTAELPVDQMLESDRTWFPRLIRGESFNANVYYREKAKGFIRTEFFPFSDHD